MALRACARVGLATFLVAPLAAAAPAAEPADVVLRLKGGGAFQIAGKLVSFDGTTYVISSPDLGLSSFDRSRFDCIGDSCANATSAATPGATAAAIAAGPVVVEGTGAFEKSLMPSLIKGWAGSSGGSVVHVVGTDPRVQKLQLLDANGAEQARFDVHHTGADQALNALRSGTAQIAMSDRPIGAAAGIGPAAAQDARAAMLETVIGLDALAIVVGAEHPLTVLSTDTLARIYGGQITDWSQLGLPPRPLAVYAVAQTGRTFQAFDETILRPGGRAIAPFVRQLDSYEAVVDAVLRDPGGIGMAPLALIAGAKAVNIQLGCGLVVQPSRFAVKTEEYPFTHRLYLYAAKRGLSPSAQSLMRYVVSAPAQDIVADHQVIDQRTEQLPFDQQTVRFAYALGAAGARFDTAQTNRLLADTAKSVRLTTTFRFQPGTALLDVKSQQDLAILTGQLRQPDFLGKRLQVLGFSDGSGTPAQNTTLSTKRAQQVRAALLAAGAGGPAPRQVVAAGYGAVAPVGCDDTAAGRHLNRRVEVWIGDDVPPPAGQRSAAADPIRKRP